jgi:uncharacterized membrane protein
MTRIAARVLLAGLVLWSFAVYGGLPASVPVHFDALGRPDAWADRSLIGWLLLPGVGAVVLAVTGWASGRARATPESVNIPDKAAFLALPEAARDRVLEELDGLLGWVEFGTIALLFAIQVARLRAASGGDTGTLLVVALVATLLASPVLIVVLLVRLQRALARERARLADEPRSAET